MKQRTIKNILGLLVNAGVTSKTQTSLVPYIRQTNTNGMLFFLLDVVVAPIFCCILGNVYFGWIFLISGILFFLCSVGLNFLGYTSLSRLSTPAIGTTLIAICSMLLDRRVNAEVTLILGAILPFTQLHLSERWKIICSLLYPLASFYFLKTFEPPNLELFQFSNTHDLNLLATIFFATPYIGIAFNTYYSVKQQRRIASDLKKSESHLSTIFSALSHDLGTPLQLISFIISKAERDKQLTEDEIKRLKLTFDRAKSIFVKLKEVAFLNGSKIPLQISHCHLLSLIQMVIENNQEAIESKKIKMSIANFSHFEDPVCPLDKELFLHQVLNNLLSNAIKFSMMSGEIKFEIHHASTPDKLILFIIDNGVGIAQSDQQNLFNWKAATSKVGTFGERGTGLGLPLVKTFLESMNISIRISSRSQGEFPLNHGTTIELCLDLSLPYQVEMSKRAAS